MAQIIRRTVSRYRIFLAIILVVSAIYMHQSCGRITAQELIDSIPLGSPLTDIDRYNWSRYSTTSWVIRWDPLESFSESTISGRPESQGPVRNRFGEFLPTWLDPLEEIETVDRVGFTGEIMFVVDGFPFRDGVETVVLTYVKGVLKEKVVGSLPG